MANTVGKDPSIGVLSKGEERYLCKMRKIDSIRKNIRRDKYLAWRREIVLHHRDWKAGRIESLRKTPLEK